MGQLNDFYIKLDRKPPSWEDRLALFIAYLIGRRQPEQTIRTYTSVIKSVLREDGIVIDDKSYLLASLLKACKYMKRDEIHIRLPIQRGLMRMLVDKVKDYYLGRGQPYLA